MSSIEILKNYTWFVLIILILLNSGCKEKEPPTFLSPITISGSKLFQNIIKNKQKYEVQFVLSPVEKRNDSIIITDHFYNFRPDEYFFPSNAINSTLAALGIQKLRELQKVNPKIDANSSIVNSITKDTFSISSAIQSALNIKNPNNSSLFDVLGQDYINSYLRVKNIFTNGRILHRTGKGTNLDIQKKTPELIFLDSNSEEIYRQKAGFAQSQHRAIVSKQIKERFYSIDGKKEQTTVDFSGMNYMNIRDFQESIKRIVYPEAYHSKDAYALENQQMLLDLLNTTFISADNNRPSTTKYFGTSGEDEGYLTTSYFIHKSEGLGFFLTATVYAGDENYSNLEGYNYDKIANPFMKELEEKVSIFMSEFKLGNPNHQNGY